MKDLCNKQSHPFYAWNILFNITIYRPAQKSVNWLVNSTLNRIKVLYYIMNLQKFLEMRFSMFSAELIKVRYNSTNWLANLKLNILVQTRECCMLTDFWAILYSNWHFKVRITFKWDLLTSLKRRWKWGYEPLRKNATAIHEQRFKYLRLS
jgi:hypothetical protein